MGDMFATQGVALWAAVFLAICFIFWLIRPRKSTKNQDKNNQQAAAAPGAYRANLDDVLGDASLIDTHAQLELARRARAEGDEDTAKTHYKNCIKLLKQAGLGRESIEVWREYAPDETEIDAETSEQMEKNQVEKIMDMLLDITKNDNFDIGSAAHACALVDYLHTKSQDEKTGQNYIIDVRVYGELYRVSVGTPDAMSGATPVVPMEMESVLYVSPVHIKLEKVQFWEALARLYHARILTIARDFISAVGRYHDCAELLRQNGFMSEADDIHREGKSASSQFHLDNARLSRSERNFLAARINYMKCVEGLKQGKLRAEMEIAQKEYESFVREDPIFAALLQKLLPVIEANPNILQMDISKHFDSASWAEQYIYDRPISKDDIYYALYFADKFGYITRVKKGRTYILNVKQDTLALD